MYVIKKKYLEPSKTHTGTIIDVSRKIYSYGEKRLKVFAELKSRFPEMIDFHEKIRIFKMCSNKTVFIQGEKQLP
jgi:hypothetical protein